MCFVKDKYWGTLKIKDEEASGFLSTFRPQASNRMYCWKRDNPIYGWGYQGNVNQMDFDIDLYLGDFEKI